MQTRLQAMKALFAVHEKGAYANLVLPQYSRTLSVAEGKLLRQLVYGVLENERYIDHILNQVVKKPMHQQDAIVREALRIGVYQLIWLEMKTYAAVNLTVESIKQAGRRYSVGFVNGVLHAVARGKDQLMVIEGETELETLAVLCSVPDFVVRKFIELLGFEKAKDTLLQMQKVPPFFVCHNSVCVKAQDFPAIMKSAGYEVQKHSKVVSAWIVLNPTGIFDSKAYEEGLFSVLDASSMEVIDGISLDSCNLVLDMCAAPGGKSMLLAQRILEGCVVSCDIFPHKIELLNKEAVRLGLTNVKAQLQDGLEIQPAFIETFDAVLLDAPCSGLGVLGRKPDIRMHRKESDITDLAKIQETLIHHAMQYVKPGGTLIFSVCTLTKEETLDHHRIFLEDGWILMENQPRLLLPSDTGGDGFYVCQWRKPIEACHEL